MTAHLLMGDVLANRPERVVPDVDGYIATVRCQELGQRYTLHIAGRRYNVVAADCAAWRVGEWPTKGGRPWLGDVEPLAGLGVLTRPTPVLLCPV